MKRLILLLALISAVNSYAWIRNITDGICEYQIDDEAGTAMLTGLTDKSMTSYTVPSVAHEGSTKYLVYAIGNEAFNDCADLTTLTIPANITLIYRDAFTGCTSLTDLTFEPGSSSLVITSPWDTENSKMLKDSPLQRVSYSRPSSYMSIYSPFAEKETLEEAFIGKEAMSVPKNIFKGCANLKAVEIEEGISGIEWYAFYDCTSLTDITLPSTLTSAGNFAFRGCTSLGNITIPASLSEIPSRLCSGCTALHSLTIPEGVQTIDEFAFYDCSALTTLSLPATLTAIGDEGFRGCSSLAYISCDAVVPPYIENRTFYSVNKKTCTLIVPAESVTAYQTAPYWKDFMISSQTAVSDLYTEAATGEWYTLQGVKLTSRPTTAGVYILLRQGSPAKKVLIAL